MPLLGRSQAASTHPLHDASIKARQTPSKDYALLFLFLPLLSASPSALLSSKMLRYPMIALFQYGVVWSFRDGQPPTGHLNDWGIAALRPCYCHFIGNWPIYFTYDTVLLLTILQLWVLSLSASWSVIFELVPAILCMLFGALGFPLRTSGSSAALLVVSHLKISWLLLQPDSQDSTWERQFSKNNPH